MENLDRFKAYSAMADVNRKWVSVMDAKAGFLSGLDAATLAFIWTGAKLAETQGCARYLAFVATSLLLFSLFITLRVILPRVNLRQAHNTKLTYTNGYQPISFFGYVAENYTIDKYSKYETLVNGLDEKALAKEALEQYFTMSHVLYKKSRGVALAGWTWLFAAVIIVGALVFKG